MPETFLINVNCSKVLDDGDETQYAMFIDSTKMSIVYELVEWIRWIFSLESCIYLTHGGLVIHELEDIKLLSQLKNFEVKPCGRSHCVHKRTYRTLLKNLDLFIYWNGMLVHKYFLHKLNRVDQKSPDNSTSSPVKFSSTNNNQGILMEYKNHTGDKTKRICPEMFSLWENQLQKSCTENVQGKALPNHVEFEMETNSEPQMIKKQMQNFSTNGIESNSFNDSSFGFYNKNSPQNTKNSSNMISHDENSDKNNLEIYQEPIKNNSKRKKNYAKPFSLGELLSNLREGCEKKSMVVSKNSSTNSIAISEDNFEDKSSALNLSFNTAEDFNVGRKRKRTRRRNKAKTQNLDTEEFISPFPDKSETGSEFFTSNGKPKPKPNHIRFELENEDNITKTDCLDDEQKTQPENNEIMSYSETTKSEPKKLKSFINNSQTSSEQSQDVSASKNTDSKMEYSPVGNPAADEDKLIDLDDGICNNPNQVYPENFQENKLTPNLNMLLSLKEKCKNGVVMERFF